jgi:hypothetical protein
MKKKIITKKVKKDLRPIVLAKLGGTATYKKYGKDHYVKMVQKRWRNARKTAKLGK